MTYAGTAAQAAEPTRTGSLAIAGATNTPDATVTIPISLLPRLISKDESVKMHINIEGDTHLAAELAKVFANMRWDYEDDLSKVVGDITANKIGEFGRKSVNTVKDSEGCFGCIVFFTKIYNCGLTHGMTQSHGTKLII